MKVHQKFTGNPDFVIRALRMRDAMRQALITLKRRRGAEQAGASAKNTRGILGRQGH